MNPSNPRQQAAASEMNQFLINTLSSNKGVHAETAVSAAARMAGTFVLRSCGLPLDQFASGSPIFSDLIDERGQQVLGMMGKTMASLKVPFDAATLNYDLTPDHDPHMNLMETQAMLDAGYRAIMERNGLSDEDGAMAAAMAAGMLIQQAASVLDPHVAYVIAVYGMVEGSKTVPLATSMVA